MKEIVVLAFSIFALFIAMASYTERQRVHDLTEACRKQGGMILDNTCVKEHKHGLETSKDRA